MNLEKYALINLIQKNLYKFSKFQQKHFVILTFLILIFTAFMVIGATKMTIESDFAKFSPKGLPITDLNEEVIDQFSTDEGILIIIQLNEDTQIQSIKDIRDPQVIAFLNRFEQNLADEPFVESSFSIGNFFEENPQSIEEVKNTLNNVPISGFISNDYSFTVMFIESSIGSSSEQIERATNRLNEIIEESSPPSDIKVIVTGEPSLGTKLFNLLISDSIKILWLSIIFIFILLVITEFSFKKALMALTPLIIGLIWTAGTLGWFDIPITVATAGLSAMLLGLGVEYSVFLIERYKEERDKHTVEEAISRAVENVGASIFSSGATTAIGFFSLGLSIFPILAGLGISLGIGILMLFSSTVFVTPLVILYEDKLLKKAVHKTIPRVEHTHKNKFGIFLEKIFRQYGKTLSKFPAVFIILALLVSFVMLQGIPKINQEEFDFETVLPQDLPELTAFQLLEDEFGSTTSARVYVFLREDQNYFKDIRDPVFTDYIDQLTQKLEGVSYVEKVSSISEYIKQENNGKTTISLNEQREILSKSSGRDLINNDYSGTIIQITASEEAEKDPKEFLRQINEILDTTTPPPGIEAVLVGNLAVIEEQNEVVGPDSAKTSLIAFLVIILFLLLLTGSVKKTILPLITVILGVLWTIGMIGWLQVPFTSVTSSVITMTIGIGIDFGIQLITRFDYELKENKKKKAMENSLAGLLTPMIITVIAALIGFRSMNLGELKLLSDLGTTMSIAVTASMLASITGVAAIMIILIREKRT